MVYPCGIFQTNAKFSHWTTGNQGSMLVWCQGQTTILCTQEGHVNGFSTVLMQSHGCKLAQTRQTRQVSFGNTTCTGTRTYIHTWMRTHTWSAHTPFFIPLLLLDHSYFPSCKGWTGLPLTPLKTAKVFCGKQDTTLSVRRRNKKCKSFSSPWYWLGMHSCSRFPTHSLGKQCYPLWSALM